MTPEALILTADFELCHMVRIAVERLGIDADVAVRGVDGAKHLERKKFDVVIVDFADPLEACRLLKEIRASRTNRSAIAIAIASNADDLKLAFDDGANFVIQRSSYETEIIATLRSAYGLILRERGRYNRFPLNTSVQIRDAGTSFDAWSLNISEGGLCLSGSDPLPDGPLQLTFSLSEGKYIQAVGTRAWQRDRRTGIQFTNVSQDYREQLDQWLALQSEQQAKAIPAVTNAMLSDVPVDIDPMAHAAAVEVDDPNQPRAIVTAIIRGGPVRAKCSACLAVITFGTTIGAPLDQERKLREAFAEHLRQKHADLGAHTRLPA
jgi:CheY-like chemotaxis protein